MTKSKINLTLKTSFMKVSAFSFEKNVVKLSLKKKNTKKDKHDSHKNKSHVTLSAKKINEIDDISVLNDDDEKMSMISNVKWEADATNVIITKSLIQINNAVIYKTDIINIIKNKALTLDDNSNICFETCLISVTVTAIILVLSDSDNSFVSDEKILMRKATVCAIAFHEWDLLN